MLGNAAPDGGRIQQHDNNGDDDGDESRRRKRNGLMFVVEALEAERDDALRRLDEMQRREAWNNQIIPAYEQTMRSMQSFVRMREDLFAGTNARIQELMEHSARLALENERLIDYSNQCSSENLQLAMQVTQLASDLVDREGEIRRLRAIERRVLMRTSSEEEKRLLLAWAPLTKI